MKPPNGNGGLAAAGPGNENNNDQPLLDSSPVVNRKLIKRGRGLAFVQVTERRNRTRYEIVSESKTWRFPLLYSAYNKWDRLVAAQEGGEQQ